MSHRHVLLATVALFAFGCGSSTSSSSICDNLASASSSFSTKLAPCLSQFGGTNPLASSLPTGSACTAQVAKCNDADKEKINGFISCLNGLPTCAPASFSAFGSSLQACAAPLDTVSVACQGG